MDTNAGNDDVILSVKIRLNIVKIILNKNSFERCQNSFEHC